MKTTEVTIDKQYTCVSGFKDDPALRAGFNELAKESFGFDFETWYRNGYWGDNYSPCALVDGERVVANVSVNFIDFIAEGEKRRFIQLGTVMSAQSHRKHGLGRFLMQHILDEYRDTCDLIYLFANDSVLDYYPRFGFSRVTEYRHSKNIEVRTLTPNIIKLNMNDRTQRDLVVKAIESAQPCSPLWMQANASLVMFYCTSIMAHNVYYVKEFDAVVIADLDDEVMFLNGVFAPRKVALDDIIAAIANATITRVVTGFTPDDTSSFECEPLTKENSSLFILNDRLDLFKDKKIMFPVLSHA